jgi:integrase
VRRNVSSLVATPGGQTGRPSKALTVEQARTLLAVAGNLRKHRLGAYVVLYLQTGIRTEEARALTWSHVDLDGRPDADPLVPPSIAVWRSVREHGDTKTRTSRRNLALPQHVVDVLRDHRERQLAERAEFAEAWQDNDLVFCTHLG